MIYRKLLGVLLVSVLALAACGPALTEFPTLVTPTELPGTEPPATEHPTTESQMTGTPTLSVPVTGAATVEVSDTAGFGQILVNAEGLSLYVFMMDSQSSGSSTCADDCAMEWPPLLTDDTALAGPGIDETLLSTITRANGSVQVTYNGWPLYLYSADTLPGDTNGQGLEGVWFLISPTGETVQG